MNVYEAMSYAANMNTRPSVGKVMVVVTCEEVFDGSLYGDVLTMLSDNDIKMHYITPHQLALRRSIKSDIFGYDATTGFPRTTCRPSPPSLAAPCSPRPSWPTPSPSPTTARETRPHPSSELASLPLDFPALARFVTVSPTELARARSSVSSALSQPSTLFSTTGTSTEEDPSKETLPSPMGEVTIVGVVLGHYYRLSPHKMFVFA